MKEESRILVYGMGNYYGVFATYRKDFIEEFVVLRLLSYDVNQYLQKNMRTYSEITYMVSCTENKYAMRLFPFKVLEGGDELTVKHKYCSLVNSVLCMLEKRMLITPSDVEL
ncbi:MAG: hypothetical protein QXL28_05125, partial [Desulfurococcaceae archaeon]